jgi:L-arabinokinase
VRAVVFYISGHGFGHAARQLEVIHAIAARRPDLAIVLRTSVNPGLLSRSLRVPYTLLEGPCDSGLLQHDSVTHDDAGTARETLAFYNTFDRRIAADVARLTPYTVEVIVGDIPPLAFAVAHALGCPSVAIANFTWDWIYEWQPGLAERPELLTQIRKAYGLATVALQLPFSHPFDMFRSVVPIPLVARHAVASRTDIRHRLGIPAERPVALLSFGGYGLQRLNVSNLDCLDTWTVMMTDRTASPVTDSSSVVFVPEERLRTEFRYEDLVGASDVVVTKPGYGILAESVANGAAVLYTSRGRFREYDLMVEQMPRVLRCRYLDQDALFAGQWRDALAALMQQPTPPETWATNGADIAAEHIASFIS